MKPDLISRLTEKRQNLGHWIRVLSEFLEIILAVIIFAAILVRFIGLPQQFHILLTGEWADFREFIDFIIDSVIGVELVHLLCQPNLDSVVEILMVAITREIITMDPSPVGTLIYVLALSLVFFLRRFMFIDKLDRHDSDFSASTLKEHLLHKNEKRSPAEQETNREKE